MKILISYVDFWPEHDWRNNIISNLIKDVFDCEIEPASPEEADIIVATIYGRKHLEIINNFKKKTILWLGENVRPNKYDVHYSLTTDFSKYSGINCRFPLWMWEIDWYNTGLGVISVEEMQKRLVDEGQYKLEEVINRKFCITIFNNPEGTRMEMLKMLNKIERVEGYGRPFNNWFTNNGTYREKLEKMKEYNFNLCLENSLYPGYYTEKCIHAKIAGMIPIYWADNNVKRDFRPSSFINLNDFKSIDECIDNVRRINENKEEMLKMINEPLFRKAPNLDEIRNSIKMIVSSILAGKN